MSGEKRGGSPMQEMHMDFDRTAVMEVYSPIREKWNRTTERDFRSFDGERRLTVPSVAAKGCQQTFSVLSYCGPVYSYGTNEIVPFTNSGRIKTSPVWDEDRLAGGNPSSSNRI
tara:strand:- start:263 stop:604 length:342 start_codon:yes stop_codon:yes gene_type:complete